MNDRVDAMVDDVEEAVQEGEVDELRAFTAGGVPGALPIKSDGRWNATVSLRGGSV